MYSQLKLKGPYKNSVLFCARLRTFTIQFPGHLFVQDPDEEEPLAGSQSCPGLAGTEPITWLQSLKTLEALMSWSEERETQ